MERTQRKLGSGNRLFLLNVNILWKSWECSEDLLPVALWGLFLHIECTMFSTDSENSVKVEAIVVVHRGNRQIT